MLNETKAGGCAWITDFMSFLDSYIALWKGNSDEGLCFPIIVPSFFTQIISEALKVAKIL